MQEKNGVALAIATESPGPAIAAKPARPVDPDMENERRLAAMVCSLENKDECLMCGS